VSFPLCPYCGLPITMLHAYFSCADREAARLRQVSEALDKIFGAAPARVITSRDNNDTPRG